VTTSPFMRRCSARLGGKARKNRSWYAFEDPGRSLYRHFMTLGIAKGKRPLPTFLGLMVASLAILPLLPPIAQDPSYHQFADQRTLLGIPNFWNVISNLPFVVVGAIGLWQFGRDRASFVLFLGIFLAGFGSAYYHWNPKNDTLFWDRLPMALTFMAILAVAAEERLGTRTGAILLWPLLALAVFSLLLWRWTDDLRLYGWVQFFPCIALPLLFVARPSKYSGTSYWLIAAALYALAKLCEFYDHAIYSIGFILSGHTLKISRQLAPA
jgi:Ceramidase